MLRSIERNATHTSERICQRTANGSVRRKRGGWQRSHHVKIIFMSELNIKWFAGTRKVAELKEWEHNPRKITEAEYARLKKSIEQYGFFEVLVIDTDGSILSGNMRSKVLMEMGVEEVNVTYPERKLTEDEQKQVNLRCNRHQGEWDFDKLANIFDIELLKDVGFDQKELIFLQVEDDEFDEDKAKKEVEEDKNIRPKRGDVWQLGEHRLMCGDSASPVDVDLLMGEDKAQLVFTDPPYNVNYRSPSGYGYNSGKFKHGGAIFNDDKTDEDCLQFYVDILANLHRVTTDNASIYWWFANKNNHINRLAFLETGWYMSQVLIWLKPQMIFSRGQDYHRCYEPVMFGWKTKHSHFSNKKIANYKDVASLDVEQFSEILDVWYERRDPTNQYIHPTQKPVRLAERGLKKNSVDGDIVIDLFIGSGSTMMGCEQLHRQFRGMELDPTYLEVAMRRWEKFTGQEAKCIVEGKHGQSDNQQSGESGGGE